ncbi:MAG: hypothetical protein AAGP08_17340, partial [Pseudomonadota bacterium]
QHTGIVAVALNHLRVVRDDHQRGILQTLAHHWRNEAPKLITVVEDLSADTALSSGLTQTKEEQIENLSVIAAKLIEKWLVEQNEEFGWFEPDGVPAKDKDTPRFQPGLAPLEVATPEDTDAVPNAETDPETSTGIDVNSGPTPEATPSNAGPAPVVEDPAPVT